MGQMAATLRRACFAAMLLSQPALQEPVYQGLSFALEPALTDPRSLCTATFRCSTESKNTVETLLAERRGRLIAERPDRSWRRRPQKDVILTAHLPISESFGLEVPEGVSVDFTFDHWETMDGGELNP